MKGMKRAAALSALLLGGLVGWARGAVAPACMDYLLVQLGGSLKVGFLIGTETVTNTLCLPNECPFSESFEVGYYEVDGVMVKIDCRTNMLYG